MIKHALDFCAIFALIPYFIFVYVLTTPFSHFIHDHTHRPAGSREILLLHYILAHKWEDNEPLFAKVIKVVVYDLKASPACGKLRMFCKIVQKAGFNWASSDICCTDKGDHFALQDAPVSMCKWYDPNALR